MAEVLAGEQAAARASFNLTYRRARVARHFNSEGIDGPDIPNAYRRGEWASSEWNHNFPMWGDERIDWPKFFMQAAISEAVHEALEWLRYDGKLMLDPHDPRFQDAIFEMTDQFAGRLYDLREGV